MANPLRTRAGFEWFDQARDLVFTWSGDTTDSVKVTSRDAQTKHAEFPLPDAITSAMRTAYLRMTLDLFELGCAAWRPEPLTEATILGYDPEAERTAYQRLYAATRAAQLAGDDVTSDQKNTVFEAAEDLLAVRG